MKKLALALAVASTAAALPMASSAQTLPRTYGYVVDASGNIWRSGYGDCWRTGYWTKELAIAECDAGLVKVEAPKPAPAPVVVAPPPPAPAPAPVVEAPKPAPAPAPEPVIAPRAAVPIPAPVVEAPKPAAPPPPKKIAIEGKASFATGKAELSPAGKAAIDKEVLEKLGGFAVIESITVEGHTDPMGNESKNRDLSKARAEAVKAYMVSKGVKADVVKTAGKGSSEPLPGVKCDAKLAKAKLSSCYEPLRRIEIDVAGTAK